MNLVTILTVAPWVVLMILVAMGEREKRTGHLKSFHERIKQTYQNLNRK